MNIQRDLLFSLGVCLLLTARVAAQTPPTTPAMLTPVEAVQHYIDARKSGDFRAAYGLLSQPTKSGITYQLFTRPGSNYSHPAPPSRYPKPLDQVQAVLEAFVLDTYNTAGYDFTVAGAAPDQPNVVLVEAKTSFGLFSNVTTFLVACVNDAATGEPRLDLEKTGELPWQAFSPQERQKASQANLRALALAITQYTQDQGHFPDAAHWADQILVYVPDTTVFRDPSAPLGRRWDYAYNAALSHKRLSQLTSPSETVMLFESSKGTKNASDTGQSVTRSVLYGGGTDYAFVDMRVKWLPASSRPSFALNGK